ncbi:hypothetical protein CVIRNUC_006612 [Coccomyxa viridis]|uniref:Amino acid transporter transmembrane domain-containing protein n=1 Tax=Coccomyxa viridis TaxID=1274662 RepID=A0AAV1I8A5_9CHLO|nr:hypothetical protein CVIRNUC_006612 [Coccomyxa viridis]
MQEYKLPITGDRSASWLSSAYHNVTAMIGAGVLGLPSAVAALGWEAGVILMVACWIITLYTLWQMTDMHHIGDKRMDRYHELGQYAFGPKRGLWFVIPFQLIVMCGLGCVYCITAGKSMHAVWNFACTEPCRPFGLSAWIVVFAALQILLSQCPNFNSLRVVSFSAAIMSLSYSTIAIGGAIAIGKQPNAYYNLDRFSTADKVFNIFNALGTIAFAYGGHNVVLEIQACMPAPPTTTKRMMTGVYIAYAIVAWCYLGVGFSGYAAFGNNVGDNVLLTPAFKGTVPTGLLIAADMMVVVHVMGSFQVYSMPVFDMIETQLVKHGISNGILCRLLYRSAYVILVAFVGITLPFFGDLLGFIGAFAFGPTTFWLPPLIYLIVRKPPITSGHYWASWFCIIFGVIVTIFGSIGGLRGIVVDASTYKFYQ